MATANNAESRRLYSWWWDSHISPKNSKWLQENLADIDDKVKGMIRIIEEDAESFAQRAEMFYRNRPELMKLVEEFYRAYRALAERYDHATGALRQAHRKMAEAFPNEIPLEFSEEPPGTSSALFERDDLPHDFVLVPSHYDANGTGRAFSEEPNELSCKTSLKQLKRTLSTREEENDPNYIEQKVTKDSNCLEEEGKYSLQNEFSQLAKENQDLNNQLSLESVRADKAESEIQHLKETFAKVKTDKEAAVSRYEECLSRASYLENELSRYQADVKKLNNEMLMKVKCLSSAEEKSLAVEKANQSLHSQLGMLKQRLEEQQKDILMLEKTNQSLNLELELLRKRIFELQEEINIKKEELEKLKISLQDEHQGRMLAEMTCQSVESSLAECQDKEKLLTIEKQSGDEKLKDVENFKLSLEKELQKVKEENGRVNEEKLTSALKIIRLQDEIISLKDSKKKLEDALDLHVEEKNALQNELCHLKEDRNDLEERYQMLREEIQAVSSNIQSLPAMLKDLKDGNLELKESIKKHEDGKDYLQNLKHLAEMSEKNAILETSISDANKELETLRERIKILEDSCYHLHGRISIHQAEKALLISQSESVTQKMEKLSKKNIFLENSLSDMNFELDGLKGKFKSLEEFCQSLRDENSCLLSENTTLVSQVESISQSLKSMEKRYAELECKHSDAEKEKNSSLQQVAELQELLRLEKEKHNALLQSSKFQLDTFSKKIHFLQEEGQKREEELEVEQLKIKSAQMKIFTLQRCFSDMKKEMVLSVESQKHQETLRCIEKIILELEQEYLDQEENIKSVIEHNEKLRELIHLIVKLLKIDLENASLDDVKDEILLHLILHEIRHLLHTISEAQDQKQHILLEKSVVLTLLEQFGSYVADLRQKVTVLEREPSRRVEEFSLLKIKNDELLEINEQLKLEVKATNQRAEALKTEVDILFQQLSHLQEAYCSLQIQFPKMLEQNCLLSKNLQLSRNKTDELEDENEIIIAEVVALDYLSLTLKSCIAEKEPELQLLNSERNYLFKARNDLDKEIGLMKKKIVLLEAENTYIKESIFKLDCKNLPAVQDDSKTSESLCEKLNQHVHTGKSLQLEKNMNLSQAKWDLHRAEDIEADLQQYFINLDLDFNAAKVTKEQIEKKMSFWPEKYTCKETENAHLHDEDVSEGHLLRLQKDVGHIRISDNKSALESQTRTNEVKFSDAEITSLLNDIHFTTVNAESFKAKIYELMKTCQSFERSTIVQKKILQEEIMVRDLAINELKQKLIALEGENRELMADLNAYLILLRSLWDDVSILEEHTISLARRHSTSTNHDNEDIQEFCTKTSQESSENYTAMALPGLQKLRSLHAKVKVLQKVVMDTGSLLELERLDSNASFDAAWKEVEWLTSRRIANDKGIKLYHEEVTKNVQLNDALDSTHHGSSILPHERRTRGSDEVSDQVLESSGSNKVFSSNKKEKGRLVTEEKGIALYQIETLEDSEYVSLEAVAEKELGIDKLVLPKKLESNQEWNRMVLERLFSDGSRLLLLQASVRELEKNIEAFEETNHSTKFDTDSAKLQLKVTEGTILKLIDINSKLAKKVEDLTTSTDNHANEKKESSQQQISDRVMKMSAKIGKLELELQTIQDTLTKADEEHISNKTKGADKRTGTLLKEYIYGKRDGRKKKGSPCGCMRPKANGD